MTADEQQRIFDNWLRKHQGVLFKVVRAYASSSAERDDLFQEIALQVWRSVPRYRGDAAVTTWLYRVALFAALTWVRKERRHYDGRESLDHITPLLANTDAPTDPRLDWLYEQIGRLHPVDRSLVVLYLEGFSYKEVAGMLGITESNVGVKLSRIKKRLAQQVDQHAREEINYGS